MVALCRLSLHAHFNANHLGTCLVDVERGGTVSKAQSIAFSRRIRLLRKKAKGIECGRAAARVACVSERVTVSERVSGRVRESLSEGELLMPIAS